MKETYTKATISSVKINDVYEFTVNATIDGANELITLDQFHKNTVAKIDEGRTFTISYKDLKKLMQVIDQVENL